LFGGQRFWFGLASLFAIPGKQAVKVVAVRTVSVKGLLIEETFNAATQANLVRVILRTDWPTHFAVPATPEKDHGNPSQTSGK
jgi:hypothetical protein